MMGMAGDNFMGAFSAGEAADRMQSNTVAAWTQGVGKFSGPSRLSMNLLQSIPLSIQTIARLARSNVFMTVAWNGHLKNLATAP